MKQVEKGIQSWGTGHMRLFQLKGKPARASGVTEVSIIFLNTQLQLLMPFYVPPSSLARPNSPWKQSPATPHPAVKKMWEGEGYHPTIKAIMG